MTWPTSTSDSMAWIVANQAAHTIMALSAWWLAIGLLAIWRKHRRGIPHRWLFRSFATFLIAGGLSRFLIQLSFWWPNLDRLVCLSNLLCAAAIATTAITFTAALPDILECPTPEQLVRALTQTKIAAENLKEEIRQSHRPED